MHDEDAAEELAARASEAALVRRPDTGPGFPAWLKRVVGRLFRRDLRDRERRERRERAAARHEATPATIDLVAEIELQQKVTRAFESLEEPSKSALFLRYFHDRTPTEIAAALGIPLGTVKSRLQRGLNQLRERLDAQHEGRREQWLAALAPWSMLGVPIVTTKSKLVPVGVAALLLAGASVVVFDAARRSERDGPAAALPNPAVTNAVAASALTSNEPSGRVDATPARAPEPDAVIVLPLASGIVVDESVSRSRTSRSFPRRSTIRTEQSSRWGDCTSIGSIARPSREPMRTAASSCRKWPKTRSGSTSARRDSRSASRSISRSIARCSRS